MNREHAIPAMSCVAAILCVPLVVGAFAGPAAAQQPKRDASYYAFRNAATNPPPGWTRPVFQMSRNYPASVAADCPECTWLKLDVDFEPKFPPPPNSSDSWVSGKWADYIKRILDYVKEGQDPQLRNEVGFRVNVNNKTRWFNVPWMAYDPTVGREFVHGTTNERTAHLSDLIGASKPLTGRPSAGPVPGKPRRGVHYMDGVTPDCVAKYPHGFETWSVGYYNEWGGYAIGKAYPKDGKPKIVNYLGSQMPDGLPFPQGTVVVKILTTNAPVECVPYLRGSPEWQIDRHKMNPQNKQYMCEREVQINRVVQIDVAVVDTRSPTRWVYGTYGFDGGLPGATFWDKLVPLGVQWGSDPWTFPAVPKSDSIPIQQSVLNPDIKIYEHFGCNGRLAGPVDNPQSSCMSCHSSAFAAPRNATSIMNVNVPPSFGFPGMCTTYSLANAAYFQNIVPPQSFSGGNFPDALSLDTSLQLEVAFQQYGLFATQGSPIQCTNPTQF